MNVAVAPRELTLDDAIAEGWRLAQEGMEVITAARVIVASGIDRDAAIACSEKGLAAYIHDYRQLDMARSLAEESGGSEYGSGQRRPLSPNHGRNFAAELWQRRLSANYEAADGTRKALLGFNLADSAYLLDLANSRAAGWTKLAEAMAVAVQLLSKKDGATIADLPAKDQKRISEMLS